MSIMPQLKREKIEERLHAVEAHTDGETVNKEAKGPTGPWDSFSMVWQLSTYNVHDCLLAHLHSPFLPIRTQYSKMYTDLDFRGHFSPTL